MITDGQKKLKRFGDRLIAVEKVFVVSMLAFMCALNTVALILRAVWGISFCGPSL
jgi:hypothetical protein